MKTMIANIATICVLGSILTAVVAVVYFAITQGVM